MEYWDAIVKWGAAVGGGLLSFLFGGWSVVLEALFFFVVADYMTGMIAAYFEKSFSSAVGLKGIAKKVCIFGAVAIAHMIDIVLGLGQVTMQAAIFFYMANELLSIVENTGRFGFPWPEGVKKAIEVLQQKK